MHVHTQYVSLCLEFPQQEQVSVKGESGQLQTISEAAVSQVAPVLMWTQTQLSVVYLEWGSPISWTGYSTATQGLRISSRLISTV